MLFPTHPFNISFSSLFYLRIFWNAQPVYCLCMTRSRTFFIVLYCYATLKWISYAKFTAYNRMNIVFITARCYASAVLAMGLCLSVCLSVTSRSSTKTAKQRITQTTPHDSPGTLVF